jgi:RNA-splicing ligase RtcB
MSTPNVPDSLAYCSGELFDKYIHDMKIAQKFAADNRKAMSYVILDKMGWVENSRFTAIHNYIDTDNMILRKGAVSAQLNEKLIIPMNMRDGSLICIGKGNADWNYSAPHGAGRLMSRSKAKEVIGLDEFRQSMDGIYTTSVCNDTIDESPMAYKSMESIIENIGDTVDIVDIIKPIYNFKASS